MSKTLLRAAALIAVQFLFVTGVLGHALHDPLEEAPVAAARGAPVERVLGEVHRLTIDDRVAGMTVEVHSLRLGDGTAVALKGVEGAGLRSGERIAVTGARNGKAFFASGVQRTGAAAPAAKGKAAQRTGKLALLHADHFDESRSEFLFELQDDAGEHVALQFPVLPDALHSGMRVSVTGTEAADGSGVLPDTVTITELPATSPTTTQALTAKAVATKSVLVILMTFTDSPGSPFTPAQVQSVFAGGAGSGSVTEYFREVSFGQQLLNPTITNWLPTNAATPAGCNFTQMGTLGRSAASAAGYNVAGYQDIVYVFPQVAACGWIGLAYVGASGVWINGRNQTSAYGHELGHNFGLLHAGSLRCSAGVIGGTCSVTEYGDPFDIMGNQSAMHYNAAQKLDLGWIPSASVLTHGTGTTTYTLSPLELAGGTTYAVKVPTTASNRTYWLEYRQPIGFDGGLASYPNNGAQVRVASPFETLCSGCDIYSNDTQLLDMTPATAAFTDATLVAGKSFTDGTYGVTFNVLSATATALTVQVTTPGGTVTPAATTTTITSSANPATVGANVTFTATVTGNAPTGTVQFSDGATVIASCSAVTLAGSGNGKTATCSTTSLTAGTHPITASYLGDAANNASASSTLSQSMNSTSTSGTNVAAAANGGVASASSTYGAGYAVASVNNGERAGNGWGAGTGGWNDATSDAYPDWVQIDFNGSKTIDHIVVYTVQDNYTTPVEPSDTQTFSLYGVRDFTVQGWNGAAWVTLGTVTGNNLVKRTVAFSAFTTDRIRVTISSALASYSRVTEIEAWNTNAVAPAPTTTSIASSANPAALGSNVVFTATVTGNAPAATVTFLDGTAPIANCSAIALTGSGNVRTATCSTTSLTAGTHSISASFAGDAGNAPSTSSPLSQAVNTASASINVAAAANGGVVTASSTYSGSFAVTGVNDGDRAGKGWGAGTGGWNDATSDAYPDWVQINFNSSKTIDRVVVYTVQDNFTSPVEPSDTQTFSLYGVRDFTVQGWNGTAWVTLGTVTGNNLVKRTVAFAAFATDRIRIMIDSALASYSRVTEIEAWSTNAVAPAPTTTSIASSSNPAALGSNVVFTATVTGNAPAATVTFLDGTAPIATCSAIALTGTGNSRTAACSTTSLAAGTHSVSASFAGDATNAPSTSSPLSQAVNSSSVSINVAAATNGGVASASSTYGAGYAVASVNNGERAGNGWGAGTGGWNDATSDAYPDWVQIDFNGSKTIDHIVVYTVQDNYTTAVEPSDTQTFSLYGVRDFTVQGWNGAAWVTLGTVTGNNLVKRTVAFSAFTTDRIRVTIGSALASYSRVTEVEAWSSTTAAPTRASLPVPSCPFCLNHASHR